MGLAYRIAIHGPSSSGKSTLAQYLGSALDVPFFHLDDIYWQPGWKELPIEELRARVRKIITQESWILDGNYSMVRPMVHRRATIVVIITLPTYITFWQLLLRTLGRNTQIKLGKISREPILIKPEHKDVNVLQEFWELSKSIWQFRQRKFLKLKNEVFRLSPRPKLIIIRSRDQFHQLPRYIRQLANLQ